jgi:hypothetical protein
MRWMCLALSVVITTTTASWVLAEDKPKDFVEFREFVDEPLAGWQWDEDPRLHDLIQQLQEKEMVLELLDSRIARILTKVSGVKMAENIAWRSNVRMDLQGGGPVRWDVFYGRNAENFFYHPRDPNTTYHTNTVLQQVQPTRRDGIDGGQGVPAHQRPPQFDYIYRAYETKQERARLEASRIQNELEVMKARRRDLENDVVDLWFKIAFRTLERERAREKAVLRFPLVASDPRDHRSVDQATGLLNASHLLATALLFNEESVAVNKDVRLGTVSKHVGVNRKAFEDSLLKVKTLRADADNKDTAIGKFKELARFLEDTSKSLSEGFKDWRKGDQANDEFAKYAGLRRIQDSTVWYAKTLLAMNEMVEVMKKDWGVQVNYDGTEFIPKWDVAHVPPKPLPPPPRPTPTPTPPVQVPRKRGPQELQTRLQSTLWKNTNGFFFEWDRSNKVWHYHKDNPRERNPIQITYASGDTCDIVFSNNKRQRIVFDDELTMFKQFCKDTGRLVATSVRLP